MSFLASGKFLILLGSLLFGGVASLVGSYVLDNRQLKNRVHDLEGELLQKYIQISTLNEKMAQQAEEINRANLSFDRYKKKAEKKYSFVDASSSPCNSNVLDSLLKKWSDRDE